VAIQRQQPGRRVQLHRALSKLGWGSRTQAWGWIRAGEVCVDGRVSTDPLTWVDLDRQRITRQGAAAASPSALTIALHKPRGIVVTRSDERGRRTVYDLLPPNLPWLFPAGRLDADSEGLLILTNDSALAVRLTEPAHAIPKTYHVTLNLMPAESDLQRLRKGVTLSNGVTRPARVRRVASPSGVPLVEFVLTEGRNRQIRRMCTAIGRKVSRLVRVAIGSYPLGDLAAGSHRPLGAADVRRVLSRKE
jgi:23S rRNA pseudouridine2605 synthase